MFHKLFIFHYYCTSSTSSAEFHFLFLVSSYPRHIHILHVGYCNPSSPPHINSPRNNNFGDVPVTAPAWGVAWGKINNLPRHGEQDASTVGGALVMSWTNCVAPPSWHDDKYTIQVWVDFVLDCTPYLAASVCGNSCCPGSS